MSAVTHRIADWFLRPRPGRGPLYHPFRRHQGDTGGQRLRNLVRARVHEALYRRWPTVVDAFDVWIWSAPPGTLRRAYQRARWRLYGWGVSGL